LPDEMKTANFEVTEIWEVRCPECDHLQIAPFNIENPMRPMKLACRECDDVFILTYERD
jgi:hypothetical protein